MDRRTYWCHQCDMSISLIPTTLTTTTSCPHCTSDVVAELDSPFTFNHNDTSLIFDSPYLYHVISHLFNDNFDDQSSYGDDHNNDDHLTNGGTAANDQKVNINGIKSVKITTEVLGKDPFVTCAVCKELLEIDDDVKELPCKHTYHPGCIIPWLLIRNSCPLCRFEMPAQEEEEEEEEDSINEDDGEEDLSGFGLRHLARRHRLLFPMSRNDRLQQTQFEAGDSGRTGNGDSGSSCPNWPVVDSVNDDHVGVVIS